MDFRVYEVPCLNRVVFCRRWYGDDRPDSFRMGSRVITGTALVTWLFLQFHILGCRTDLDCDLKRWRLRADILNDVSMFLDVCSSNFGGFFVHIACASALLKAIVVIAGLGTRPAIIQHQARRNNIGDGKQSNLIL